jgi:hypothetical protein
MEKSLAIEEQKLIRILPPSATAVKDLLQSEEILYTLHFPTAGFSQH